MRVHPVCVEIALHEVLQASSAFWFALAVPALRHEIKLRHARHQVSVVGVREVPVVTEKLRLGENLREFRHLEVQRGGARVDLVSDFLVSHNPRVYGQEP